MRFDNILAELPGVSLGEKEVIYTFYLELHLWIKNTLSVICVLNPHSLSYFVVGRVRFAVAGFTNCSHIKFHETMVNNCM